jgi:hypothetical protein
MSKDQKLQDIMIQYWLGNLLKLVKLLSSKAYFSVILIKIINLYIKYTAMEKVLPTIQKLSNPIYVGAYT